MRNKILVGADWSMTCPALCIYNTKDSLEFDNCQFYFLTQNKKFDGDFGNIHGFKMPLYDSQEERFDIISSWAMKILDRIKPDELCLEGYSMGSRGKIFDIAENIGLLKHKIWKSGIPFITPAPTQVKKFYTGKGNANKDLMFEASVENHGLDFGITKILKCKPSDSPIADIVDSFAMVAFLIESNLN